jgi:hypothetical protein
MRYSSSYHVVFRNSGLAVSTVLLRMGLSAPPYFNVMLGILATLFALGLTLAYNRFAPLLGKREREHASRRQDAAGQPAEEGDEEPSPGAAPV